MSRTSRREDVDALIVTVRGHRVILSPDLAVIYGVETRTLNQAVRRNRIRFPPDFLLELTQVEAQAVARSRSQSVILNRGSNIKYPPLGFTEHGALMAATVLNSARAVQMSIFVVRAFLRMRALAQGHADLRQRLDDLDRRVGDHDAELATVIRLVRQLVEPPEPVRQRRIGFRSQSRKTLQDPGRG